MNSITLASSTAGRIGQLVRLLASDKSGEVIAAASAIKRTLLAVGLDMHAFAEVTEKALSVLPPRENCTVLDVALIIKFCLDRADKLTDREWPFISDMNKLERRLGKRLVLTAKQEAWLLAIFERLRGVR
jgi:hypothetical protein